jgi:glycosyltransferase involved in cell wall biosynthesis
MACGTPVIAWRCGSVPEVVQHGVSGLIVDNIEEAVKAVHAIAGLSRARVRRAFDERFTAQAMARRYGHLYWQLVRNRRLERSGMA